jgi:hypothetical protein
MRLLRPFSALLALSLLVSVISTGGPFALAQSTEGAERAAEDARRQADIASGLVDEAVANREEVERQLADSITRLNELTAQLSLVGTRVDRVSAQRGFADVELASIQSDIETQAVDAYMTVVASPSVHVVSSGTMERALVASSVVEDVVADGQATVSELAAKRNELIALQETLLEDQDEYRELQEEVDAETERYTNLYEQADAELAAAIRDAEESDRAYRAALDSVALARAKEQERQRQEQRDSPSPPTTGPPNPPPSPTTTSPPATTAPDGGGGTWNHPPAVEQWRSLVSQFFPSSRVEEALVIINCESNGDPNAANPYSGASGLFQFLPSTWATTAPNAGYAGYSVFDPEANTASAAWLANRYQELGYDYWHAWSCKRHLG